MKLVFKCFLKLRANISLNSDISLAQREIRSFFSTIQSITHPNTVEEEIGLPYQYASLNVRRGECIGFIATGSNKSIFDLVRLLNFTQEIWLEVSTSEANSLNKYKWSSIISFGTKNFICAMPLMACGELLSQTKSSHPNTEDVEYLISYLAGNVTKIKPSFKAPTYGGTSTQHVHSLHKYKAKFFPRLIRSLLVAQLDKLPKNSDGQVKLLDPFVGSGTALIEAALLGINSFGVDIDKLSCAISQAKINALTISPNQLITSAKTLGEKIKVCESIHESYKFPHKIARKFERLGTSNEQYNYEEAITRWRKSIASLEDKTARQLFNICLSDALTRKFVIRMMGTGVGRFALEIAKTSLDTLMTSNFKSMIHSSYVAQNIIEAYDIKLGKAKVHYGNAINLPFPDNEFSIILTSPPYLPASSGREDYLVGKSISTVALNLMTDDQIEAAEANSIGSMKNSVDNADDLPKAVYELFDWLSNDPLRAIKAKPILTYYASLKQALIENMRVLLPNGLAIYVIGKESVFYRFSDRKVLYKAECDNIFAELAKSCGFIVEEKINVELDKKNRNARPRSLDSFYETVFILKKPRILTKLPN